MRVLLPVTVPSGDGWTDLLTNTNFPGIIVLALAALGSSPFIVKGLIKLQKDFIDYYGKENEKLKTRLDASEAKNEELELKNDEQRIAIIELKKTIGRLEIKIEAQDATIKRLNEANERRNKRD